MSAEPARVRALSYDGRMNRVRVQAPAKVNLFLGVGEVLPDGYHAVTTVMHAIDLRDEVVIRTAGVPSLTCIPDVGVPVERNLAWRAAEALGDEFGREPRVEITLTKSTPHGAGLGGGSSDAAAVIAGLAHLWGAERDDERCIRAARAIGADVAFFLGGTGCALMTGRGDVLERELPGLDAHVLVVRPLKPVPTVAAYAAFDADPVAPGAPDPVLAAIEAHDTAAVASALANNLEKAAISVVPAIADALAYVQELPGALGGAVSGSGSAVFAICDSAEVAEKGAADARLRGWWGQATRLRPSGVDVVVEELG